MLVKKCVAEILGTFVLVTIGCGAALHPGTPLLNVAFAFGLAITIMVHAIGDISGCHINPMVTLSLYAAKRIPFSDVIPYIVSQVVGAVLAALLLKWLFPGSANLGSTIPAEGISIAQTFVIEFIATLLLMFSVLAVVTGGKEKGMIAALTIGFTVLVDILFCGPLTGASMNPARTLGPALVSGDHAALSVLWVYMLATIAGGMGAVALNNFIGPRPNNG